MPSPVTDPRTVLVVEDNPVLAESMAFALSAYGWTVVGPVGTGAAALEELAAGRFAVATLDVDLGEEMSFPVAKKLQEGGVPFVFLTGYVSQRDFPERFKNEMCLQKPVMPDALIGSLESLLANRAGNEG